MLSYFLANSYVGWNTISWLWNFVLTAMIDCHHWRKIFFHSFVDFRHYISKKSSLEITEFSYKTTMRCSPWFLFSLILALSFCFSSWDLAAYVVLLLSCRMFRKFNHSTSPPANQQKQERSSFVRLLSRGWMVIVRRPGQGGGQNQGNI